MYVLFLTVLIDLIGFGMVIPILPFAAPRFGASELDIALLLVSYSVCGALFSPLWGQLSDRWGRKKTLLSCLAGGAVCYVLLGQVSQLWALYAVRIAAGCFAGNFGVASAMAADISTPQTRARAMGIVGAAFGLGMVVGPSLGGLLSGPGADLTLPARVAAGLSAIAMLCGGLLLREPQPAKAPGMPGPARRQGTLLQLLAQTGNTGLVVQYLTLTAAISTISYLFPLAAGHFLRWGPHQVGIVFGVQGLMLAALQAGLIGRLVERYGELRLLRLALAAMIAGFALATCAHTPVLLLCAFFVAVTGAGCCTPIFNTLLSKRTPPPLRGRMLGTAAAASAWGRVFGPLVAGLVLSRLDYGAAWAVGAIVAGIILWWALRMPQAAQAGDAALPASEH